MRHKVSVIPYFLFSQALADGLRITFSILAPVLLLRHLGYFEAGLAISLGAVCANIPDIPGPLVYKRNGLLIGCGLIFLAAMLSGVFHIHFVLTAVIIAVFTFIFSMFAIYGVRAATIGSAALLVLILSLNSQTASFHDTTIRALLITGGALWYTALSLLLSTIRPYRAAQRAMGECIRETAKFLHIKAAFYDPEEDLETNYRELLSQQVIVNEKQNDLRELLFKTRQIVKDTSGTGRLLMLTFVETVDLYEQILASHYNYEAIRLRYKNGPVLKKINFLIRGMSFELNAIGFAVQSNQQYTRDNVLQQRIDALQGYIDAETFPSEDDRSLLQKMSENISSIYRRINDLAEFYTNTNGHSTHERLIDHRPFVSRQDYSPAVFFDNLTFRSSAFRHSLRVTIACLAGFATAHLLSYGHHSYWILITLVFIMKPAFGLTKKRNIDRLAGTAVGGLIGVFILFYFQDPRIHFIFLLAFMLGTYSFMRINYITMVIFTTPYVLILFKLLGSGYMSVVEERVIDTSIGCCIALLSGYILFPKWEADHLEDHLHEVLRANRRYLHNYALLVSGKEIKPVEQKLSRKDVFVSSANLSAAFQRMLSEPSKRRKNSDLVYEFVVLNHILSSNIAGLAAEANDEPYRCTQEEKITLEKIEALLTACIEKKDIPATPNELPDSPPKTILGEQLHFILRLSMDISKAKGQITG